MDERETDQQTKMTERDREGLSRYILILDFSSTGQMKMFVFPAALPKNLQSLFWPLNQKVVYIHHV